MKESNNPKRSLHRRDLLKGAAAILVLMLFLGQASVVQSEKKDEIRKQAIKLGPGSTHPGTTGEVRLELEEFFLEGDPHACGIIWDLAVDAKKGELFVLCEPKRVGGVGEVRVFDRSGAYLRTIMPLNPTLPYSSVRDITQEVVREDGTELIVPKFDLSWGEPAFYGSFWDSHKKIALAPDGDLVISDLYRGKLMRMGPDGSLPEAGWNSGYALHVSGTRGSAIANYLPFDSLRYPYFHFGPDGSLYISGGQSSFESRYHHYNLEGGVNKARYHFPVEGDRSSYVWKFGLKPGPKVEKQGIVGGFKQASGIVVDGDHIVVADAGNNRLKVCTIDGKEVASITHYTDKGKKRPILDPTALALDNDKRLYVLIGSQERPKDLKTEGSIRFVQKVFHAPDFEKLPPPRKVIKLQSWNAPELLAKSAPVHTYVMQITVDAGVSPPLVWVANGDGPGSLQQLSGKDLSLKAQWQDDGSTLSNPRQDSGMPILNIDPETGHVYVEDDARYRHKKFGTAYRLDQQGNILKTWDPYFIDIEESGLISPWGATNLERGFPHPEEPLFLDSVFAKDGRVYRWKLGDDGVSVLRFDRAGKPVPFSSTGSHELFVDKHPIKGWHYKRAHLNKQLTCWWDVYSGMDIDSEGSIYYAKKQDRYVESEMMLPRYGLHRQLDVYDSTGKLKQKALLDLTSVKGIQVDKEGYLYIVHIPADGSAPRKPVSRDSKPGPPKRYPMRPFALSKFAPTGGEPLWSQPWDGDHGMGFIPPNPHCICSTHRVNQALDDKGYIYMATKYSVQVVDTETGKLVGEFGSYGNADCKGKGSKYPHPELPFGSISSLAVWKDKLFVMDVLNRRLVKCNITYDPALKNAK